MNELVRKVRLFPDGVRTEHVLVANGDQYILTTVADDGTTARRDLPGPGLSAALAAAPELTAIDAVTRIDIACVDREVHTLLVAALQDPNPGAPFEENAWPEGTEDLPGPDEWASDEALRHRWVTIDGDAYHLLAVGDRTLAVHVDEGEILSGEEIASSAWDFEGIGLSSFGRESLRIVGGDKLVRQNMGDDFPGVAVEPFDGDVVSAVVQWLDANCLTPTHLLRSLPAPGLTPAERTVLVQTLRQDVSIHVDRDAVLDRVSAEGNRNSFRRALAEPDSPDGQQLYAMLRAIIAGDEAGEALLETLV